MTIKELRQAMEFANAEPQSRFFEELVDDLTALRSALTSALAKLDLDAGVTDTNFASTCSPPALKTRK
jgi:hypothetical protein